MDKNKKRRKRNKKKPWQQRRRQRQQQQTANGGAGARGTTFHAGAHGATFHAGARGANTAAGAHGATFHAGARGATFNVGARGINTDAGARGTMTDAGARGATFHAGARGVNTLTDGGALGATFHAGARGITAAAAARSGVSSSTLSGSGTGTASIRMAAGSTSTGTTAHKSEYKTEEIDGPRAPAAIPAPRAPAVAAPVKLDPAPRSLCQMLLEYKRVWGTGFEAFAPPSPPGRLRREHMPQVADGHLDSDAPIVPIASRIVGRNYRRAEAEQAAAAAALDASLDAVEPEAGAPANSLLRHNSGHSQGSGSSTNSQGNSQVAGAGAPAAEGANRVDGVHVVAAGATAPTRAPPSTAPGALRVGGGLGLGPGHSAPQISSGLSLSQLRTPPRRAHRAPHAAAKGDPTSATGTGSSTGSGSGSGIWRSHSTGTLAGSGSGAAGGGTTGLAFGARARAGASGDHRSSSAQPEQQLQRLGSSHSSTGGLHTLGLAREREQEQQDELRESAYYRSANSNYSTAAAATEGAGGVFARPPPRFSSYSLPYERNDNYPMTTPKSGAQGGDEGVNLLPENLLDTPAPKSRGGGDANAKKGEVAPAAAAAGGQGQGGEGQVVPQRGGGAATSGAASELGQLNGPASFQDFFQGATGDGPSYKRSRASSNEQAPTTAAGEGASRSSAAAASATTAPAAADATRNNNIRVAANDSLGAALREHESPTAAAARAAHLGAPQQQQQQQQHRRVSSASGGSGASAEQKVGISPIFGPQNGYYGYMDYPDEQGGRAARGGIEGRRGSQYEAHVIAEMRHREREHLRKYGGAAPGAGVGVYDDPAALAGRYASGAGGRHAAYPADYPNASGAAGGRAGSRSIEAREREARAYQQMRQLQQAKMLQNAQRNEKQRFHTQTLPRREREMLTAAYYQQQQGERERGRRGDEREPARVHMSDVERIFVLEQQVHELKLRLQSAERRAIDMQTHVKLREQDSEQYKQENRVLGDERDALLEQVTAMRMQSRRAKETNAALLERAQTFEKKCDWYRSAYSKLQAEQMKAKQHSMAAEGGGGAQAHRAKHLAGGGLGAVAPGANHYGGLGLHRERTAPFPGRPMGPSRHHRTHSVPFPGAGAGTFRHTHEPPRAQMRGGVHVGLGGPGGGGLRVSVSNTSSPRQVPPPGKDGLRANVAAWTPKNVKGAKNAPQTQTTFGGGNPTVAASATESKAKKDAREDFKKAFEELMPKDPRAELKSAVEKRVKEEEVSSGRSSPVKSDEEGKTTATPGAAQLSSNAKEFVPTFGS